MRIIIIAATLAVVAALSSGCVVSINGDAYDCTRDDSSFPPSVTCVAITDANPLVVGDAPIGTEPIGRTH